jgi:hypothetical protein
VSTRVEPEDYPNLKPVPRKNYKSFGEFDTSLCVFPCDVSAKHGAAVVLMQTDDHRAIALCENCKHMVLHYDEAGD